MKRDEKHYDEYVRFAEYAAGYSTEAFLYLESLIPQPDSMTCLDNSHRWAMEIYSLYANACSGGQIDVLNWVVKKHNPSREMNSWYLDGSLYILAAKYGRLEMIK
jgi:hypothetical protein